MSMYGRMGVGGMPAAAPDPRARIAQTMMNIGRPPPQVQPQMRPQMQPQGGLPPGMQMAPTPLKNLMGLDEEGPSSFMGGRAPPIPQQPQQPPTAPPLTTGTAGPMPLAPPPPPADPSSLFAAPPAVPGQAPPQFAKPPTF